METRQKILYGVLGIIVLYFGGEEAKKRFVDEPFDTAEKRHDKLEEDLVKAEKAFNRAKKTSRRIENWEARSLPKDPNKARTVYQEWLVALVERSGFTTPSIDSGKPSLRKGIYHSLSFSVRVRGTLDQLTKFLYEFYHAGHLHQIQSIGINPLRSAGLIDLNIKIEALALSKSAQQDQLSTEISKDFADRQFEDYSSIIQRNVFGVGAGDAAAELTLLTGTPAQGGRSEAWFKHGGDGSVMRLKLGETLQVGHFTGTVVEIQGSEVILESGGERWLLSVGETLNQASALPPEY